MKYGLVLEGGGTRGAYHIGVYKALMELNYEIKGVVGSSIGALNGALIAQGDWKKAEYLWTIAKLDDITEIDAIKLEKIMKLDVSQNNIKYLFSTTKKIFHEGGLDITPFREILNKTIDIERLKLSLMDFGLVTYNLTDKRAVELFKEEIKNENFVDFLLASSNLPVFQRIEIEGKKYLDGYFHDNLPINMMIKRGFEKIIAVRTINSDKLPAKILKEDIEITIIKPSRNLGGSLEFNHELIESNMKMGYFDAYRNFKNYKGRLYYINQWPDEIELVNKLMKMDKEILNKINRKLKFREKTKYRQIFEDLLPYLENQVECEIDNDYIDLIIFIMEDIAEKLELNYLKFYDFNELKNKILESESDFYMKDNSSGFKQSVIKYIAKEEDKYLIFYDLLRIF